MHLITFCPSNKSSSDANDSMWVVPEETASWTVADLGKPQKIKRSEVYFVCPTTGHAYVMEYSADGKTWKLCGGHHEVIIQSPHADNLNIKARFLRLKILKGADGIWEWRIY
jgi:hypothetical protein